MVLIKIAKTKKKKTQKLSILKSEIRKCFPLYYAIFPFLHSLLFFSPRFLLPVLLIWSLIYFETSFIFKFCFVFGSFEIWKSGSGVFISSVCRSCSCFNNWLEQLNNTNTEWDIYWRTNIARTEVGKKNQFYFIHHTK